MAFGSGGGLLQKLNRDTQKCAFKCAMAVVDGEEREVFKDPITDPGKKTVIRLYVPGGEEELAKWLAAIERCCQGVMGSPSPPPFAATPVAVF